MVASGSVAEISRRLPSLLSLLSISPMWMTVCSASTHKLRPLDSNSRSTKAPAKPARRACGGGQHVDTTDVAVTVVLDVDLVFEDDCSLTDLGGGMVGRLAVLGDVALIAGEG